MLEILNPDELITLLLTLAMQWLFPIVKLRRTHGLTLALNGFVQLVYLLFFLWCMKNRGSGGTSLVWMFYGWVTVLVHLVGLHVWTVVVIVKRMQASSSE